MTRSPRRRDALVLALVLTAVSRSQVRAQAPATHRAELRVAHIGKALAAVRQTPPDQLRRQNEYARALSHGACSSSVQRLKVECLMTASRRWCRNQGGAEAQRCQSGMDIVLSNLLGEAQLIPTEKRYQIMSHHHDYRRELARELRRIVGALAVDFRLRMGETDDDAQLARRIDQYCLATADETNLAWQTCVASLVWFIGSDGGTQESRRAP